MKTPRSNEAIIQQAAQAASLVLPPEIVDDFTTIAHRVGQTHRMLGAIVDSYVSEFRRGDGRRMVAYGLFADLYYQVVGERVSPRTVRAWRKSASEYTKHELDEYQSLTDSQLTAAIELSEIANCPPGEICEWAVENDIHTVPAMYARFLPQTWDAANNTVDVPAISSLIRTANRYFSQDDPRWTEFNEILSRLREILRPPE